MELDAIRRYIATDNPAAAAKVQNRIVAAIELLSHQPLIGRMGRVPGTREFVFGDIPYIAVYDVDERGQQVTILHIIHTARRYPSQNDL